MSGSFDTRKDNMMAMSNDTGPQARLAGDLGARRTRERQAGIAGLFSEAGDIAPAVLGLQKALLAGIGAAQQREAKRLEARGDKNRRVGIMTRRAERAAMLGHELGEAEALASRIAESLGEPGIFHGYVRLASGAPAVGYGVRASAASASAKRFTAKTDESGYFRMAVEERSTKDTIVKTRSAAAAASPSSAVQPEAAAAAAAKTGRAASVDIRDPAGRLVYRDPAPPQFDGSKGPAFRFYPLLGKNFAIPPERDG